jgi:hypothetical protein
MKKGSGLVVLMFHVFTRRNPMNETFEQDQEMESLLRGHLEARLAPQLGRARRAFAREVACSGGRRQWVVWLSCASAVAAGLAIAWGVLGHRAGRVPSVIPKHEQVINIDPIEGSVVGSMPAVRAASFSGFTDDGMVVVEDQPMRRYKRTVVEESQYYDTQARAMIRTRTPREQVYFIGMNTD